MLARDFDTCCHDAANNTATKAAFPELSCRVCLAGSIIIWNRRVLFPALFGVAKERSQHGNPFGAIGDVAALAELLADFG